MCVDGQQLIPKHFYSKVVLMSDLGAAIPAIGSYEEPSSNILECRGLFERLKIHIWKSLQKDVSFLNIARGDP
ncbi:hypothetical protein CDAR_516381 [Caerostris darwini]|uniref:Uncharacterized protein n=1 Tax=Caerostris darwini TaxID=1538125 RepID=A0AAV4U8T4_9ARAC|nr:hypothetical protein CDAR_516381 [Caerostris darwini]